MGAYVYVGRFADSQAWQQKADELRKLDVKFERVNTPTALAPGLSLGQFTKADAPRRAAAAVHARASSRSAHGVRHAAGARQRPGLAPRHGGAALRQLPGRAAAWR